MLLFSYNCDYYDYILYEKKRESEREIKYLHKYDDN